MKKAIFSLIFIFAIGVQSTYAMMPEEHEKYIRNSEQLITNLEKAQLLSRSSEPISYREKILNPNFPEAAKFIDSLGLPMEQAMMLKHYNLDKTRKPMEDFDKITVTDAQIMQQIQEAKKKHEQRSITSIMPRSPIIPSIYNRSLATSYALKWAYGRNPEYPDYSNNGGGGDCTNFVSQALRAGGLRDIFGRSDWATYWFFRQKNNHSMTWSHADSFARHIKENSNRYTIMNNISELQSGDVIAVDFQNDGIFDHIMMVTNNLFSIKLTYHSVDTKDLSYEDFRQRINVLTTKYILARVN